MTMSQIFITLSYWLHSLATVVLIGNYLLLSLIFLPVFVKSKTDPASGTLLSEISKRSRLWIYTALAIFIITGIYLMLVNSNYLGLGKFGNSWSIFMLVKHILVVGMIAIGFLYNAVLRVGPQLKLNIEADLAFKRFRQYSNAMAVMGVVVLLFTALSQAQ
jgi:uncharacterized membrane protein